MTNDRRKRPRDTVRDECYDKITNCMKSKMIAYYDKHPELFQDERSRRAIVESSDGLRCIIAVLDGYAIEPLKKDDV